MEGYIASENIKVASASVTVFLWDISYAFIWSLHIDQNARARRGSGCIEDDGGPFVFAILRQGKKFVLRITADFQFSHTHTHTHI